MKFRHFSFAANKKFYRYAKEVNGLMNRKVSKDIAEEIHLISFTCVFYHLRNKNYSHWVHHLECFCFECRFMDLFRDKLIEGKHQKYLFVINFHNYNDYSDLEILEKVLKNIFSQMLIIIEEICSDWKNIERFMTFLRKNSNCFCLVLKYISKNNTIEKILFNIEKSFEREWTDRIDVFKEFVEKKTMKFFYLFMIFTSLLKNIVNMLI